MRLGGLFISALIANRGGANKRKELTDYLGISLFLTRRNWIGSEHSSRSQIPDNLNGLNVR